MNSNFVTFAQETLAFLGANQSPKIGLKASIPWVSKAQAL